jgi:magnesium-protoporphyrin IX monomethyl ester (oxidative) cyclase
VFRITSEICRQVFPVALDLDNPAFARGLDRMWEITQAKTAARARGGLIGRLKNLALTASAGATFIRMFLLPAKTNALPSRVRMALAW